MRSLLLFVCTLLFLLVSVSCWFETSSSDFDKLNSPSSPTVELEFVYHNYAALTDYLKDVSEKYPNLTHLYSIGKSVQGRDLWVLAVSSTPDRHVPGKAEVKYIGNIHGNEPVSKELLLHFILYLVSRYPYDLTVKLMLDESRIHFLPSMNPDGYEQSREGDCKRDKGRKNFKDYDLNRNFPDFFKPNALKLQPETSAVIEWMKSIPFILSAGLHGGTLVASYPYENFDKQVSHIDGQLKHASPDDDVFQHLATVYATNHATMSHGKPCKGEREGFPNGIINGAAWYAVTGGMQDYNYIFHGTMELTLEISCCKYPLASTIEQHWLDNKKALLSYSLEALRGVQGFVIDKQNGAPLAGVQLRIKEREARGFNTTKNGEFRRILLDGDYILMASTDGYWPIEVPFQVINNVTTKLNVTMQRINNELTLTAQDLLMENSNDKPLRHSHSLPLPIIPNYSVVLATPSTSGHHILGLFPKSLSLPSNRLIWIDDLPFPEDSRLVLALPTDEEPIQHFQPLGIIAKNVPKPSSTSILNYNFPPLSVPGGFLNPTNAHLIIATDNNQSDVQHVLLLGLLSNSHPLIRSLAPSQLVPTEILPLPVGCWSPIDQQNSMNSDA